MQQRILLIQLRQLGDILLTTPCIREVKKSHPKAKITFLSHPMGRLILDGCPYLDEFYTYDPASKWAEWKLSRQIKDKKFDIVIDFMNNPRSAFYCWSAGAIERVGFKGRRSWAYTEAISKPNEARYIVQEKFELLRAIGAAPQSEELLLPWLEHNAGPMLQFFSNDKEQDKPRIALSPTHRRENRRWPMDRFASVADFLARQWHAKVVWLWGPGEEDYIDQAMGHCSERTYKAPKTDFREMAALMANHDFFIGNSNGPSHVAVATNTASLQIHGPTNPISWCPMIEAHRALGSEQRKSNPDAAIFDVATADVLAHLESRKQDIFDRAATRARNSPRLSWRK